MAGVAGFKVAVTPTNDSAKLIRDWIDHDTFVWLITTDIVKKYKAVLRRLRVRPALIGTIVNLLREEAEVVRSTAAIEAHPDPVLVRQRRKIWLAQDSWSSLAV